MNLDFEHLHPTTEDADVLNETLVSVGAASFGSVYLEKVSRRHFRVWSGNENQNQTTVSPGFLKTTEDLPLRRAGTKIVRSKARGTKEPLVEYG